MYDIERKILTVMLDPKEITQVWEQGLRENAFEDITCRKAFGRMVEYWQNNNMLLAPTRMVMEHEFPTLKLETEPFEEATEWMVGALQQRLITNKAQKLIMDVCDVMEADPEQAVRTLRLGADEILKDAGRSSGQRLYTDVAAMLDDELPASPVPEILSRTDGVKLFYRHEVNIVFGDPEHGKTWVVLAGCAEVLSSGGRVLVADLDHNGAAAIVSRLLMLGAPKEALRDSDRFRLCEPDDVADVEQLVIDCALWCPDVVVIDSTGELLPMFGASSDSGDDFTRVHNRVLQPLADTGAAVLLVDHLAKGRESRSFGPGGSMAKRRTVGGLSLRVERERPFTRVEGGSARLMVNKDRHGGVRDHCAARQGSRDIGEQVAGVFVLGAIDDGGMSWLVMTGQQDTDSTREFRPTTLMERASKLVEDNLGMYTRNQISEHTSGRKETLLLAVDLLEREGYFTKSQDRYPRYTSVKPYRQAEDPQSESQMSLGSLLRQHNSEDQNDAR